MFRYGKGGNAIIQYINDAVWFIRHVMRVTWLVNPKQNAGSCQPWCQWVATIERRIRAEDARRSSVENTWINSRIWRALVGEKRISITILAIHLRSSGVSSVGGDVDSFFVRAAIVEAE